MFRKTVSAALLVVFALSGLVSARPIIVNPFLQDEKAEKKKLPPVNWIRSRTIDVKHILIDLKFDWDKEQAYGTSTITLAPFNSTNKIALDAAYMSINGVTLSNGTALKYNYAGKDSNDNLEIILDRTYKAGEDITVKVDYKTNYVNTADAETSIGSFGRGLRFIKPTADNPNKPMQIWSQGESEFNRYWFPGYDSPNDFRTTELKATVDKKFTVVSNGKLMTKKSNTDGTVTFDWKMDVPYSNYLTSIVIGEYAEVKSGEYAGIPIVAYGYKNESKEVYETTKSVPDMVKFFSEKTGVKYAYPKYSQAMAEDFGGGMENISATTQVEEMIHDSREMLDNDSDSLQAHELAHQWFGDYVTCRDWGQIWLNESFATYFDALYNEHSKGHESFLYNHVRSNQNSYYQTWAQGNRRPIVTKYYADKDALFDTYAYPRGGAVLHMLRKHLGEENWWKAISHYLKSNANQPVSTEDFRIAIEESTGESMDWFFDQWIYKMGHPIFEITDNYDPASKQLTLRVKQTQKIDETNEYPQAEFFQSRVDVEIDGRIESVWLKPLAENVFTFDSATKPKIVNFDYEGTLIKEMKFAKSVDDLIFQLLNDKDILGRRWAMGELVTAAKAAGTSAGDKEKISAALRETAASNSYWGLRSGAIQQLRSMIVRPGSPMAPAPPTKLDDATVSLLLKLTKDSTSGIRADATDLLATTKDAKYASTYLAGLNDQSYRVVTVSANALGTTKDAAAFDALMKLVNTKSWHDNLATAGLRGLSALGDSRGFDVAFKIASDKQQLRGTRIAALSVVAATGKGDQRAYPLIFEGFKKSLEANDFNGIFNGAQAIIKLADPRGQEAFDLLKAKLGKNPQFAGFVSMLEGQFKAAIAK